MANYYSASTPAALSGASALQDRKAETVEAVLLQGEALVQLAEVSPWVYWKSAAMALVALVTLFYSVYLALYLGIIALGLFFLALSARRNLLLAVTDRRVLIWGGILSADYVQLPFDSIESLVASSLPLGRMFGYGSVVISGTGRRRIIVPYIRDAIALENEVALRMSA